MSAFLAEVGTRAADRWSGAVVIPGLLWTAVLLLGTVLPYGDPFDVNRLAVWMNSLAAKPASHSTAAVALTAALALLASIGAGQVAAFVGTGVEQAWTVPGLHPPASWLLAWRQSRWDRITARTKAAVVLADRGQTGPGTAAAMRRAAMLTARRNRMGRRRPTHPTRVAERFHVAAAHVRQDKGVNLEITWPRLWTVLPEALRTDIAEVRTSYASAARLTGWGLLYVPLTFLWWPALAVGTALAITGTVLARARAGVLADLLETSFDLHLRDLAEALGLPSDTAPSVMGNAIMQCLLPPRQTG